MLKTLDLIIIVVYLVGVIAIGLRARGGQQSAEDYFTAGGGVDAGRGVRAGQRVRRRRVDQTHGAG